jgi:hypothetical protein
MVILSVTAMDFKKVLSLFDLTNIVVGSVIGADVYIASDFRKSGIRRIFSTIFRSMRNI